MPVFSLPSPYGIGCFSKEAYDFVLWLCEAGQSYWQILPTGPTGYGDSPYQSFSVFAGNPYFIDLEELIDEGVLKREECDGIDFGVGKIDYEKLYKNRYPLLKKAYERSELPAEYSDFVKKNAFWLEDYALFMACKEHFGGAEFTRWDEEIRQRNPVAVQKYTQMLSFEIGFHKYLQYKFYSGYGRLKEFANKNGIRIIGDIPIYTSADSCDVWANHRLFEVEKDGTPVSVAGCPPDGFSKDGQLWGNPTYNWEEHQREGFSWWIKRLGHCFDMFDCVRIDHFRGFDEYYSIPYGEKTAKHGKWKKAPGKELFSAVCEALGEQEIIAEDLGFVTDSVKRLVKDCGFAGMKILQFGFDSRDSGGREHLPHNYPENCAAYTGTHDNSTLTGWIKTLPKSEKDMLRAYLCDYCTPDEKLNFPMIGTIMRSRAKYCIIPLQDWLGADDSARINTPSTSGNNWKWRAKKEDFSSELAAAVRNMTKKCQR